MITLSSDSAHPDLCPARSALRMVLRPRQLKQPDAMPLRCYRTKKSPLVYLTASRIAALIQEVVSKVPPWISAEDLSKYSAHLLQVWACVLLQATALTTSKNNFVGWATPSECTSATQESFRVHIAKPCKCRSRKFWPCYMHSPLTSCRMFSWVKALLMPIWLNTLIKWTDLHSYIYN